ncbi:MAG: UDP-N-acetylmuramate--L-alanine ligase [Eubacteriales bacterium]|nr:UDP-N-acetylmuramate--L-alanine ligase [Eubacteriales bacterium]
MNNILGDIPGVRRIHFIGIGGISMSGLAQILFGRGFEVSGSDMTASDVTDKLSSMGIAVSIGHDPKNMKSPDLVIYTAAIRDDNPELLAARRQGIPAMPRSVLLGRLMTDYSDSVAVAGTHGKTTTTAMIASILLGAGKDPTIHVGGNLKAIGGPVRAGGHKYFVTEACEYRESFLELKPYIGIILNIEYDHADYFRDLAHVRESFLAFAGLIPKNGYVIACADDSNAMTVMSQLSCNKVAFSVKNSDADWSAKCITIDGNGFPEFMLCGNGEESGRVSLKIPGRHNVYNALASVAACSVLGCSFDEIRDGLAAFTGINRRLEFKGIVDEVRLFDDYAHHPTEISASLSALASARPKKLWCVYQPHTYSRTIALLTQFASAFDKAGTVVMVDIYAAREKDTGEISSKDIVSEINKIQPGKAVYMNSFESAAQYVKDNSRSGDIVVTMGAGNVNAVGDIFTGLASPSSKI